MSNKKCISVLLILVIIFSLTTTAIAVESSSKTTVTTTIDRADALKEMGLFAGTNKGYELEVLPTRTQAIVFLLRMLGEENIAQNSTFICPFTDVPDWAYKSIAYAYNKGYTAGISKTAFGADELTTPAQFVTFMLRALDYSDKDGDFAWNESVQKAEELGILPVGEYRNKEPFTRGDCVDIIYSVLDAKKKGSDKTLAEFLIEKGAIDGTIAEKYGLYIPVKTLSQAAQHLYNLGLFSESDFSGTSVFSLDRAPTKLEATVMYIKILGREQAALFVSDARSEHPYTDVPEWAKKYVAYTYWNKLISGNSATMFGSSDTITIEQFLTYILRALEYDATEFNQANVIRVAEEIGLVPVGKYTSNSEFKCSDCADIIFNALKLNKKLEGITIAQSLVYYGAISDITAAEYSLIPSTYQRIKIPLKLEGKNNMLYNKDVISAIPNAKYMSFGGFGSNSKMPFSYYRAFHMLTYKELLKTKTDASIYEYFTNGYHNLNNYYSDKDIPGYGYTIATVYDSSFNIIATAIFDAKSALEAGDLEFVLINIDTKKYMDYIAIFADRVFGNAKELPSDVFYFERYKEMITIIDKETGEQKKESFLNNNGDYMYKVVINKDKYPDLASAITMFNDIFINDQPITVESMKNDIMEGLAEPFSNGKYTLSNSIDSTLSYWTNLDYEWNRKRAFVFSDENGFIIGWVNYIPSQVKIVDIGTIQTTIYE